jgi:hypothetical protein
MLATARSECARLTDQLERGFRGGAWHGPAIWEVLSGVDARVAAWRPAPEAHSIVDLVGHLTYWMRDTGHHLGGIAPASGSDWPEGATLTEMEWKARCEALEAAYRDLQTALGTLDDGRLEDTVPGSDPTIRGLLLGTLQHNAYHSGQMALLRKLAEARP